MNLKPTICRVAVLMAAAMMALTVSAQKVKTGIEMLKANNFKQLEGKRVGLVTNPTGVDNFMKSDIDILHEAKNVKLVALFGVAAFMPATMWATPQTPQQAFPSTRSTARAASPQRRCCRASTCSSTTSRTSAADRSPTSAPLATS